MPIEPLPPTGSLNFRGLGCQSTQFVSTMLKLLQEQISESDGVAVSRSRALSQSAGAAFFRFSPALANQYYLDTKDDEAIVKMLWEAEVYIRANQEEIQRAAKLMKTIHSTK